MVVQVFAILVLFAVTQTNAINPCATVKCAAGTTCRLQAVTCVRAPCPPVPICHASTVDPRKCGAGPGPVLNSQGAEIFCGRGPNRATCPDNTTCVIDPLDRFAVCCWQDKTKVVIKPGQCPRTYKYYGPCYTACYNDGDCPGTQKCCGSCPRRCMSPDFKPKPGQCPKPTGNVGTCIAKCSRDADCPSNLKCCGSCPRECVRPVVTIKPGRCPRYTWLFSCNFKRCTSDADCAGTLKCCRTNCGRMCTRVKKTSWFNRG